MQASGIAVCQLLVFDATYSVLIWHKQLKKKKNPIIHTLKTNCTWQLVQGPKAIHGTAFKGTPLFSKTGSKQKKGTKVRPQTGFLWGGISTTHPWGPHHLDGAVDKLF